MYISTFYREIEKKVNMKWHPNGTVSYRRQKWWYFDRSKSVGPLTDVVTTINVPVVGSAEFGRGSFFMEWGISDMLSTLDATLFVNRTVGELLFDGYEDTVMDLGSSFGGMGSGGDDEVDLDKFGWFYKVTIVKILRSKMLFLEEWNNLVWRPTGDEDRCRWHWWARGGRHLEWSLSLHLWGRLWPGARLLWRPLPSWSGQQWQPPLPHILLHWPLQTSYLLQVGTPDCPRNPSHKLQPGPQQLCQWYNMSGQWVLSEQRPHWRPGHMDQHQLGVSVQLSLQNVTQCKMSSPVFVSRPHFYLADPSYGQQFQYGVKPDPHRHDSVFWIEPLTSIPAKEYHLINRTHVTNVSPTGGNPAPAECSPEKSCWYWIFV